MQHVQMLAIQAAAQMGPVKPMRDVTVILSATQWVTAVQIFQKHVPGKYYSVIN